jgi:hypothetical protein
MPSRKIAALFLVPALGLAAIQALRGRPALGVEDTREEGRFQSLVVGSQTRLFAAALLLDTRTGATRRTTVRGNEAQPWSDVLEVPGEMPAAGPGAGRFQISGAYVADKSGQEAPGALRVDTATGKTWFLQIDYPTWRWAVVPAGAASSGAGKK